MNTPDRYQDATAFRAALEQRLRSEARALGVPLNRLRKEAAFNRLLVRLDRVAPNEWALKGGLALIFRLGAEIRGTNDADANWRATRDALEIALSDVETVTLGDLFEFSIGDARPLLGEGESGALRYSITARLGGRTFEQLILDVNIVGPDDTRPVERVLATRNPFEFAGEPRLNLPMVTPAQQLAEKLHAYTRDYDDGPSTRAKDLFDMLVIAHQVRLPSAGALADASRLTFAIRRTTWPPNLVPPPADWTRPWTGFVEEYPLPWVDLPSAFNALSAFWRPVIAHQIGRPELLWDASTTAWTRSGGGGGPGRRWR